MSIRPFFCAVALFFAASSANALGMTGQPVPTNPVLRDAVRFSEDIISSHGDKGRSRPQLLVLIETNASIDLVERFAPALRDANTYTAVLATYDDALASETDPQKQTFIRYNTLRTIVARARYLTTTARRALLSRATTLAETLAKDNRSDAAVWEVTGDLYALKDDVPSAVGAYRRMVGIGSPSRAYYKTAQAYQRVGKWDKAIAAYEAGIRADSALGASARGKEARHLLYQGLASVYIASLREEDAVEALLLSAQVKMDADAPYPLRLEVAEVLLRRGYAKQVREYATAVLKLMPDDEGTLRLLAAASAATP